MKIEPFYVCSRCQRFYIADWKFHLGMRGNNQFIANPCDGTLKPAFFAECLLALLDRRIEIATNGKDLSENLHNEKPTVTTTFEVVKNVLESLKKELME